MAQPVPGVDVDGLLLGDDLLNFDMLPLDGQDDPFCSTAGGSLFGPKSGLGDMGDLASPMDLGAFDFQPHDNTASAVTAALGLPSAHNAVKAEPHVIGAPQVVETGNPTDVAVLPAPLNPQSAPVVLQSSVPTTTKTTKFRSAGRKPTAWRRRRAGTKRNAQGTTKPTAGRKSGTTAAAEADLEGMDPQARAAYLKKEERRKKNRIAAEKSRRKRKEIERREAAELAFLRVRTKEQDKEVAALRAENRTLKTQVEFFKMWLNRQPSADTLAAVMQATRSAGAAAATATGNNNNNSFGVSGLAELVQATAAATAPAPTTTLPSTAAAAVGSSSPSASCGSDDAASDSSSLDGHVASVRSAATTVGAGSVGSTSPLHTLLHSSEEDNADDADDADHAMRALQRPRKRFRGRKRHTAPDGGDDSGAESTTSTTSTTSTATFSSACQSAACSADAAPAVADVAAAAAAPAGAGVGAGAAAHNGGFRSSTMAGMAGAAFAIVFTFILSANIEGMAGQQLAFAAGMPGAGARGGFAPVFQDAAASAAATVMRAQQPGGLASSPDVARATAGRVLHTLSAAALDAESSDEPTATAGAPKSASAGAVPASAGGPSLLAELRRGGMPMAGWAPTVGGAVAGGYSTMATPGDASHGRGKAPPMPHLWSPSAAVTFVLYALGMRRFAEVVLVNGILLGMGVGVYSMVKKLRKASGSRDGRSDRRRARKRLRSQVRAVGGGSTLPYLTPEEHQQIMARRALLGAMDPSSRAEADRVALERAAAILSGVVLPTPAATA